MNSYQIPKLNFQTASTVCNPGNAGPFSRNDKSLGNTALRFLVSSYSSRTHAATSKDEMHVHKGVEKERAQLLGRAFRTASVNAVFARAERELSLRPCHTGRRAHCSLVHRVRLPLDHYLIVSWWPIQKGDLAHTRLRGQLPTNFDLDQLPVLSYLPFPKVNPSLYSRIERPSRESGCTSTTQPRSLS